MWIYKTHASDKGVLIIFKMIKSENIIVPSKVQYILHDNSCNETTSKLQWDISYAIRVLNSNITFINNIKRVRKKSNYKDLFW